MPLVSKGIGCVPRLHSVSPVALTSRLHSLAPSKPKHVQIDELNQFKQMLNGRPIR